MMWGDPRTLYTAQIPPSQSSPGTSTLQCLRSPCSPPHHPPVPCPASCHRSCPHPHRDLALLLTSPRFHSWRGEKRGDSVSGARRWLLGQPSISQWDRVSPGAHKEDTGGCRVLWSPLSQLPHLDTKHRLLQLSPNIAAPRASLLLPQAGRARLHAHCLSGTPLPHATISVPPSFPGS